MGVHKDRDQRSGQKPGKVTRIIKMKSEEIAFSDLQVKSIEAVGPDLLEDFYKTGFSERKEILTKTYK